MYRKDASALTANLTLTAAGGHTPGAALSLRLRIPAWAVLERSSVGAVPRGRLARRRSDRRPDGAHRPRHGRRLRPGQRRASGVQPSLLADVGPARARGAHRLRTHAASVARARERVAAAGASAAALSPRGAAAGGAPERWRGATTSASGWPRRQALATALGRASATSAAGRRCFTQQGPCSSRPIGRRTRAAGT